MDVEQDVRLLRAEEGAHLGLLDHRGGVDREAERARGIPRAATLRVVRRRRGEHARDAVGAPGEGAQDPDTGRLLAHDDHVQHAAPRGGAEPSHGMSRESSTPLWVRTAPRRSRSWRGAGVACVRDEADGLLNAVT